MIESIQNIVWWIFTLLQFYYGAILVGGIVLTVKFFMLLRGERTLPQDPEYGYDATLYKIARIFVVGSLILAIVTVAKSFLIPLIGSFNN